METFTDFLAFTTNTYIATVMQTDIDQDQHKYTYHRVETQQEVKRLSYIILFCWESTNTNSRGIGLDNSIDLTNVPGRHAQARTHPSDGAVGGGYERIRA